MNERLNNEMDHKFKKSYKSICLLKLKKNDESRWIIQTTRKVAKKAEKVSAASWRQVYNLPSLNWSSEIEQEKERKEKSVWFTHSSTNSAHSAIWHDLIRPGRWWPVAARLGPATLRILMKKKIWFAFQFRRQKKEKVTEVVNVKEEEKRVTTLFLKRCVKKEDGVWFLLQWSIDLSWESSADWMWNEFHDGCPPCSDRIHFDWEFFYFWETGW